MNETTDTKLTELTKIYKEACAVLLSAVEIYGEPSQYRDSDPYGVINKHRWHVAKRALNHEAVKKIREIKE